MTRPVPAIMEMTSTLPMAQVGARTDVLVITGAPKTGTSTMARLANSHDDVFVLFEAHLLSDVPSYWAREFLAAFPAARRLYYSRQSLHSAYIDLAEFLGDRGFRYRWVGVKQPELDALFLDGIRAAAVVYCTRDVRTWLVKRQVRINQFTALDVVPAAAAFTAGLIESFDLPRVLHVTTEDVVDDIEGVQRRFAIFLDLGWTGPVSFWETSPASGVGDPKRAISWTDAHKSSGVRPYQPDVRATVRDGPFWDALLPVFGRYHSAATASVAVPDGDQRRRDLELVRGLPRKFQLPFADAFDLALEDGTRPPSRLRLAGSLAKQAARVLTLGTGR